jgi:hypothetical protein
VVSRYLIESLEYRLLLAGVSIHALDSAADRRFFVPAQRVPTRTDLPIAAPANAYSPFTLNLNALKGELNRAPREFTAGARNPLVLRLPTPDGTLQRFNIVDAPIMEDPLAKQFPQIRTFRGQGLDDPSASVRLDYTPLGFHAMVIAPSGRYYIDPYYLNDAAGTYISYYRRDLPVTTGTRANDVDLGGDALAATTQAADFTAADVVAPSLVTGGTLRTFRAAVAADHQYVAAVGGGTVAGGLSAVTTAINRVTGVYESEIDVRLVLIANESSIIYASSAGDPYGNINSKPSQLLSKNQSNLDSVIGNANYDIGHVFSTAGGGLATLGCVGKTGLKARAETGLTNPTGDAFYIDYVAHEMGHQFGADHTFNTSMDSNIHPATAYEPGSGSTIMAYAGLEGTDEIQPHSDPYFNSISLQHISSYLATIPSVGTSANTGNTAPTVSAGSNYTIPTGTPFALTASGSDPNGDPITFEWEEMDLGPATLLTTDDNGASPLFRDWVPSTSPTRTVPQLAGILNGSDVINNTSGNPVEKLFAVARTSHWRVIARDNKSGGGGVATADMTLSVVDTGAAFVVTNLDSATTWTGNSTQTITWNVAGTTGNGIDAANVKISLSTDGGQTFSTVLAASTPNDGSQAITLPNVATTNARIKVEAVGNVFFDINNANLTIQQQTFSAVPGSVALAVGMDTGTSSSDNVTKRNNASGNALQFTVSGTISGATVTLFANGTAVGSATASGTTTTITPSGIFADQKYDMTATQTEPGKLPSSPTGILTITIDTVAPTIATPSAFAFESLPQQIAYSFSENVGPSLVSGDVSLANNTHSGATLPTRSLAYDSNTNQATLQFNSVLPDGEYTATLAAANVTDVAGNALSATDTLNFFFLAGDGSRNETVGIEDFNLLASNFGKTGKTFTQGNYDYSSDGAITITDFNVLATNFGKTSKPPAGQTSIASFAAKTPTSTQSSQDDVNLLDDVGLL